MTGRQRIVLSRVEDVLQCLEAAADDPDLEIVRLKNRLDPAFDSRASGGFRCAEAPGLQLVHTWLTAGLQLIYSWFTPGSHRRLPVRRRCIAPTSRTASPPVQLRLIYTWFTPDFDESDGLTALAARLSVTFPDLHLIYT